MFYEFAQRGVQSTPECCWYVVPMALINSTMPLTVSLHVAGLDIIHSKQFRGRNLRTLFAIVQLIAWSIWTAACPGIARHPAEYWHT
jgi:hypothetical protein